ncbi:MAG: MoxR family ATPase [Lysobacterales bacterium]|jgi:MoxR-like ATPase
MTEISLEKSAPQAERLNRLRQAIATVNQIILGKEKQIELAFSCLLARGHLLIEDLPGVGKTTLAHALATVIGARYQRIQFTSDMLPADILGMSIYRRDQKKFEFHPGPIFAELVLADEINRATPKSQSALLEAMAEGQVTIEGATHVLPEPFFVIATQNPLDLVGTFPLPNSQLDRFMLNISLGFPVPEVERQLLLARDRAAVLRDTGASMSPEDVIQLNRDCQKVHAGDALLDYLQDLMAATRNGRWFENGLSPRAGIVLLRCCKAHAFLHSRDFVTPDDVKAVFPSLARHRLSLPQGVERAVDEQISALLSQVTVP